LAFAFLSSLWDKPMREGDWRARARGQHAQGQIKRARGGAEQIIQGDGHLFFGLGNFFPGQVTNEVHTISIRAESN
jgi:hypothetical protein